MKSAANAKPYVERLRKCKGKWKEKTFYSICERHYIQNVVRDEKGASECSFRGVFSIEKTREKQAENTQKVLTERLVFDILNNAPPH